MHSPTELKKNKPRILFIISKTSFLEGVGGHWRSLRIIASELYEQGFPVTVCTLSNNGSSPIFDNCIFDTVTFPCNPILLPYHGKKLKCFIDRLQPDIVHLFDHRSLIRCLALNQLHSIPTVFTKPGGPMLKFKITPPSDVILFSHEDITWFQNNIKTASNYHLIPNRAVTVKPNTNKVQKLKTQLNDGFILLRICRIGVEYKDGIVKTILLIRELKRRGVAASLALVGSIDSQEVFDDLMSSYREDIYYFTTKEYYKEGSQILPVANAVVAVGRGVQEAMSLGLPVLCPGSNNQFPILITNDDLFNRAMKFNFSQRTIFPENYDDENLQNFISIIQNKSKYQELSKLSLFWFDEYFNVKGAVSKLQRVYNQCTPFHYSYLDTMAALLREIKITITHRLIILKRKCF
jgi:glycosyltransferase involved in cell wall biosynthesis